MMRQENTDRAMEWEEELAGVTGHQEVTEVFNPLA